MRTNPIRAMVLVAVATALLVGVTAPPGSAGTSIPSTLVRITETSAFDRPSTDPSGLALMPNGRLLLSDSEVEETPWYAGINVFRVTRQGAFVSGFRTTRFSIEPAGVEITKKQLIVSDDDKDRIFFVRKGKDRRYGTRDDKIRSFGTRRFGSRDPEGVALGGGFLFISDGTKAEMFRLAPGRNGIFDGVAPKGDDRVVHFDTAILGQGNPEGIEYRASTNTVFLVSNKQNSAVTEASIRGALVATIDTATIGLHSPAGLAWAPASTGTGHHLYIADRGVDNVKDPNENDGRILEIAF